MVISLALTAVSAQTISLNDSITTDPDVRIGKLDNGLVYYIRQNKKPENRIELRLAVNAGSMQETDGQRGLAHFTEHMCFNGTTNFPKNELIDYLQKTGVKFGADINAYTSFDETVYMLQLPADKKDLIDQGFQVLEDWAHLVSFENAEIDKERGIITEEWRMGLGADDRMRKKYFPVIFKNSRYAERLPIGDIDVIKTFAYDTIRQFYKDWYRPNLQAVIVVGDFDVNEMEQKIIAHFSGLKNPAAPKPRVEYNIPENTEPLVALVTDKEATATSLMIIFKHPHKNTTTLGDYREGLCGELYTAMLNERLREYQQQASSPFIYAYNYYSGFLARSGDAYSIVGQIKENMIEPSLELLMEENERVLRYGYVQSELDRMKEEFMMRYEKQSKEYDKTESGRLAGMYVGNFLSDKPIPGARAEFQMVKSLLPTITLEEINALSSQWVTKENLLLVVTAPDKENINIPTEQKVLEIVEQAKTKKVDAYVDRYVDQALVNPDQLKGSPVVKRTEDAANGITELEFKNGVKLVLKSTNFKNDEILFSAVSPGGSSLYPDKDYISAVFATQIIIESGLGPFDNISLKKKLKGKTASVNPMIDGVKEGFSGKTNAKDLEVLLQLTYLYFTAPNKDSAAFSANLSRTRNQLKFAGNNPTFAFMDTLIKTSSSNDPRVIVLPKENQLSSINLDRIYEIFKDRFSNAGDFTFFMVGNLNIDSVIPLAEKYLGSLPVTGRVETFRDESAPFPAGATNITLYKGKEPKAMVGIVMQGDFEWTDKNKLYLRMLREVISIKLIEIIREEMSGVYSPQVQMSIEKYPKPEFSMMIMFGCSPGNTKKLPDAVFGVIDRLRKKGPTEVDLKKVQELLLNERETDLKTNKWWLTRLENVYFQGETISPPEAYQEVVKSVTIQDLKTAANTFFVKDHYVKAVLLPETK